MTAVRKLSVAHARRETISGIADRMLREAAGNLDDATTKMVNYISSRPHYVEEILRIGCRKLVSDSVRIDRAAIERDLSLVSPQAQAGTPFLKAPHRMNEAALAAQRRLSKLGAHSRAAMLDMPIAINGVRRALRDIVGTEIEQYGQTELQKATTGLMNARFYIAIGQKAGAKKVGDVVSEREALALHNETHRTPA